MNEDLAQLEQQARHATEQCRGKTVSAILHPRDREVVVQFADGTRLYIEAKAEGMALSFSGERTY